MSVSWRRASAVGPASLEIYHVSGIARGFTESWRAADATFASSPGMMVAMAGWRLEHTYAELPQIFHSQAAPTAVREPRLAAFNRPLAAMLGLEPEMLESAAGAAIFAGNVVP